MRLFGFEIVPQTKEEELPSFVPPSNEDGALVVSGGGVVGTYVDMDGSVRTEAELVNKYRQIALDPTVDMAIQDIVNEAIVEDTAEETVSINLDSIEDISDKVKERISEEFKEILKLLEFNSLSYEIFKRWYIDGRLYYHVMIDEKKTGQGIKELRYIDPRHIKKIKEVKKNPNKGGVTNPSEGGNIIQGKTQEYYIFNPAGFVKKGGAAGSTPSSSFQSGNVEGLKIAKDSIVYCTSGLMNPEGNMILSYLHKAIRPFNQLRSMEDSMVIYRISRAPERRIFYVDVGGLPKAKAEQYLHSIMTRFKNRVVYDSSTGEIRDDRKFMTMLEDFWLPRRDGGRGTQIDTLPGGTNLGEIEDIVYFQNLLYRSLNVPITRLQPETSFTLGRATEVSRDEVKFAKFITRLRSKFSTLFKKLLRVQLILKKVITEAEWKQWEESINFDYAIDNYFEELKEIEIMTDRMRMLTDMDQYIGRYFSHKYVRTNILRQTEDEIKEIDKDIKKEEKDPQYNQPEFGDNENQWDDVQSNKAVPGLNQGPAGGDGGAAQEKSIEKKVSKITKSEAA